MRITKHTVRNSGVACGVAAASAALAMATATSGWGVSTAIVIGGIGTPSLHDVVMSQLLGGALQDYDQRVSVNWPAEARPYTGADDMTLGDSIRIGTANLDAAIDDALGQLDRDANGNPLDGEEVTVVGLSAGSLVVTETLRGWNTDNEPNPDADELNVVVVADSSRQQIVKDTGRYNPTYDYTYQAPPQTPYDTVEVTGEYDGLADYPDRFNLNSILNASAGSALVHIPTMFSDLSEIPKQNTTVTTNAQGGTTVRYLVPAERLPLVVANPSLAPREAELKASVDRGYTRNDPVNVAARLAGPDVPQSIRDIVTPDGGVQEVDLATTAALQQDAETEATTAKDADAPLSLSEQLSAALSNSVGDDAKPTPLQRVLGISPATAADGTTDEDSSTDPTGLTSSTPATESAAVDASTEASTEPAESARESRGGRESSDDRSADGTASADDTASSESASADSGSSDSASSETAASSDDSDSSGSSESSE